MKWPAFTEETVTIRVDLLCSFTQSWTEDLAAYTQTIVGAWETVKNMIVFFIRQPLLKNRLSLLEKKYVNIKAQTGM